MARIHRAHQTPLTFLVVILMLTPLLAVARPQPASAAGVVTACTEAALRAALEGGGHVIFTCSGVIPIADVITITADTTIDGGGDVTIDGQQMTQLFHVPSGVSLELNWLTLANGRSNQPGGAIHNQGDLTVVASTLTGNTANGQQGGAINNFGTLTIAESTLSGNRAGSVGGAIANMNGTVTITTSELSGNQGLPGGALYNSSGVATIAASTFAANHTGDSGGALYNLSGTMTVTASTLANNSAFVNGGAIFNVGELTVAASTLAGNGALDGGAIYSVGGSTTTITASILSGSKLCAGQVAAVSHGFNVASNMSCRLTATGDLQNIDPKLGNLQDNGGPTDTILPQAGSPALDRVPNDLCATLSAANEGRDQRGFVRPVGDYPCDSGAVEVGAFIQDIAVAVVGMEVQVTVTASDPLGGLIWYRIECAGGVIGPRTSPTATCDFANQTGQFAIVVEATDANGIGVSRTVLAEIPTYLCVGERSGAPSLMDGPGDCSRGNLPVVLTADGSWSFCVGDRSGSMRYLFNPNASCLWGELKLTLPQQGPVTVCVGERSRSMRYESSADQCSPRGELVYRIANRVS